MRHPQGVTKRCRLSWLTNSALVHEPKCVGGGGFGVSASERLYTGAQINFGDLTPYLIWAVGHPTPSRTKSEPNHKPNESRRNLLSQAAPCWARPHPTQLSRTQLSHAATYLVTPHWVMSHTTEPWDSILKLLRSPGIDFKESIPPAYLAWRAGTTNLFLFSPHRLF